MELLQELVARLKMVKAVLEVKDTDKLWEYHLPNNPATDDKIQQVMHDFNVELPVELIEFWKICNGWNCFYQMVDLLGTEDYYTSKMDYAKEILSIVLEYQKEFELQQLFPIAISRDDMDIFVVVVSGKEKGKVVWYAGGEIERFDSFKDFLENMAAYCEADIND